MSIFYCFNIIKEFIFLLNLLDFVVPIMNFLIKVFKMNKKFTNSTKIIGGSRLISDKIDLYIPDLPEGAIELKINLKTGLTSFYFLLFICLGTTKISFSFSFKINNIFFHFLNFGTIRSSLIEVGNIWYTTDGTCNSNIVIQFIQIICYF